MARAQAPADTLRVLSDRVSDLDAEPIYGDLHGDVDPDLAHFIRTIGAITPPGTTAHCAAPVAAHEADEILAASKLLQRLKRRCPPVAAGPLVRTDQYWVATGRPAHLPPREDTLDPRLFVDARASGAAIVSTKPFELGLYTSTGVFGTFGMWWCYLQLNSESSLFPRPWKIWALDASPQANVLEIATAAQWVELVWGNPLESDGLLYPDWKAVAGRWDGIHMSAGAVAATHGICFSANGRVVAPPYWDVESTLWLRWSFPTFERVDAGRA
jgi:hypothetical protein